MSEAKGWVCVHRQLLESQVFKNEGLLKVWIWCLLKASHKGRWVEIDVGKSTTEIWLEPGQFVFGRHSASTQLRMNPATTWKRIKKLETMRNLIIKSNNHYSLITIVNWDAYQDIGKKSNNESDSRVTAEEQPSNTNNNVNPFKQGGTRAATFELFTLTDDLRQWADQEGYSKVDLDAFTEHFRVKAAPYEYKDLAAAWKRWLADDWKKFPAPKRAMTDEDIVRRTA